MLKTLHLIVDRPHFERIVSEKRTDWRKIKPFYTQRLEGKQYERISFRNGYRKDSPRVVYKFKGYETYKDLYMLFLGDLVSMNDAAEKRIDQIVSAMFENSVNDIA